MHKQAWFLIAFVTGIFMRHWTLSGGRGSARSNSAAGLVKGFLPLPKCRAIRPLLLPFPAERKRKGPRGLSAGQFFFPYQGNSKKASVTQKFYEIILVYFDEPTSLFRQAEPLPLVSGRGRAFCYLYDKLNPEIPHRIIVGNIPYDLNERIHVRRIPARLHHLPDHAAENAAEILVPRIG